MTSLSLIKTHNKTNSSTPSAQTLFNRQKRKLDNLRFKYDAVRNECEQALAMFHSDLKVKEKLTGQLIAQYLEKLKQVTQNPRSLSRRERGALQELMQDDLSLVFRLLPHKEISSELKQLYKELYGENSEEGFRNMMAEFEQEFKEFSGLDEVDFSKLHPDDSMDELIEKVIGSLHKKAEENEIPLETPARKKSKRELLKEEKARQLEKLQSKNINNIYKRLAKELHPDLERDPVKRAEKEEMMKRLTLGYQNEDLLEILKIESEWFAKFEQDVEVISEETLKIYNSILKNQIKELEEEISLICLHPRYMEIFEHIKDYSITPMKGIQNALSKLKSIDNEYKQRIHELNSKNPLEIIKNVLGAYQNQSEFADLVSLLRRT